MTLPTDFTPDNNDSVCRYTGSGYEWDCATTSHTSNSITRNGVTTFSDWAVSNDAPMAVTLEIMQAVAAPEGGRVDVTWTTAQEVDNQGFNLWRGTSPAGPDLRLNADIIPSQAPGQGMGADYAYADTYQSIAGTTYYYWLEDVSLSGVVTRHEPVSVTYMGPTAVGLADFGAVVTGPNLTGIASLAALALAALAGAGLKRRR